MVYKQAEKPYVIVGLHFDQVRLRAGTPAKAFKKIGRVIHYDLELIHRINPV